MAKSDVKAPAETKTAAGKTDITIAEKLVELYRLQHIDSQIDRNAKLQRLARRSTN